MGQFQKAQSSLAWLRGWTTAEDVKSELEILKKACSAKIDPTSSTDSKWSSVKNRIKRYFQRSFCLPLASMSYIFILRAFMGTDTIQTFAEVIFDIIGTPFAKYMTIGVYFVEILGATLYIFLVSLLGKRSLLFITLLGTAFTYLIIAISMILINEKYWTTDGYNLIPAISILLSLFIAVSGVDTIVIMLSGEVFPNKFRDFGTGIGMFVNTASMSVMNKIFLYMVQYITMPGVFLFFAVNSVIGLVTFYFIVPETEEKTLMEIEEHYAKTKN